VNLTKYAWGYTWIDHTKPPVVGMLVTAPFDGTTAQTLRLESWTGKRAYFEGGATLLWVDRLGFQVP